MSESTNQDLSRVTDTTLITVYSRALESQRPGALFRDDKAVALVANLGYDWDHINRAMTGVTIAGTVTRTLEFDRQARDFLARHADAVVVHIGCGLDSRFERVDNGRVEWYDLDLPEIIDLRRKFIGGDGGHYHLLGCSVLDSAWLEAVSVPGLGNRPFLFLAEGVSMYLDGAQVRWLVLTLRERFPGAELVFDAHSPLHIWVSNRQFSAWKLNARLRWGIWRGQEIEGWGAGIRLLDEWGWLDPPDPRLARLRALRGIPFIAKILRIYHFRLGEAPG